MAGTYLVKKYANRKLYDTVARRYVTLDVVGELVRSGADVRVVDQVSGDDITDVTLAQLAHSAGVPRMARPRAASHSAPGRSTASAARATAPVKNGGPFKRGGPLGDMVRASLTLSAALRQRAVAEVGHLSSLDAVLGRRRGGSDDLALEVAELRIELEALTEEVERLHGELAELRPLRQGAGR